MIIRITLAKLDYHKQVWLFGDIEEKKWHEHFQDFLEIWKYDYGKVLKVETNKSDWIFSTSWCRDQEAFNMIFFSNDKNKKKAFRIFDEMKHSVKQ